MRNIPQNIFDREFIEQVTNFTSFFKSNSCSSYEARAKKIESYTFIRQRMSKDGVSVLLTKKGKKEDISATAQ